MKYSLSTHITLLVITFVWVIAVVLFLATGRLGFLQAFGVILPIFLLCYTIWGWIDDDDGRR